MVTKLTMTNITQYMKYSTGFRNAHFTVIENKYTRNKEQETNVSSKEKNAAVGELLEVHELHHRF